MFTIIGGYPIEVVIVVAAGSWLMIHALWIFVTNGSDNTLPEMGMNLLMFALGFGCFWTIFK